MKKIVAVAIAFLIFSVGFYYAYELSELLNKSRCLGCIALLPKASKFHGFWTEYPPFFHKKGLPQLPQWLLNESKNHVVILFFWYKGCDPCKAQWEDMVKAGIVVGSEENGKMAANYSKNVSIITIDIVKSEFGNLLEIFTPAKATPSTPTTVILFTTNQTYWYAFSGRADGKAGRPSIEELEGIIREAIEEWYVEVHA